MSDPKGQISCTCGASQFEFLGAPLFRTICHCGICQRYNGTNFADISVFYDNAIIVNDESTVAYTAHKKPAILHRGTCAKCKKPAIEKLRIPGFPKLVIVPNQNVSSDVTVPMPSLHIFYDNRVQDADDTVPKHIGFLRSQVAFSTVLIRAMLRNRN